MQLFCIFVEIKKREMLKINQTKLLVEDILESVEKTPSGILIPTTVKASNMKGKVLVVGEGTPDIKIVYEVGETVLYHPQAGLKFNYENKDLRLIDISDVFLGGI